MFPSTSPLHSGPPVQMTIREALNSAIDEEMEKDDSVVLMGKSSPA